MDNLQEFVFPKHVRLKRIFVGTSVVAVWALELRLDAALVAAVALQVLEAAVRLEAHGALVPFCN